MQAVTGEAYVGAVVLLEAAERAAAGAQLADGGNGGDYFLHVEERITSPGADGGKGADLLLHRPEWWDQYFLDGPGDHRTPVPLLQEPGNEQLIGQAFENFADLARRIGGGLLAGRHALSVAKFIAPAVALSVTVTRTVINDAFPATRLDLRLMRSWSTDDDEAWVSQLSRIESDPGLGTAYAGERLLVERWGEAVTDPADELAWESHPVAMPHPTATIARLQHRNEWATPLDRPLTIAEWHRLLARPLDLRDQLIAA
jgi:hypothetical protein